MVKGKGEMVRVGKEGGTGGERGGRERGRGEGRTDLLPVSLCMGICFPHEDAYLTSGVISS